MRIPKIQFRQRGIVDIIWWTRPADIFCIHLKHWKEGAGNSNGCCTKHPPREHLMSDEQLDAILQKLIVDYVSIKWGEPYTEQDAKDTAEFNKRQAEAKSALQTLFAQELRAVKEELPKERTYKTDGSEYPTAMGEQHRDGFNSALSSAHTILDKAITKWEKK